MIAAVRIPDPDGDFDLILDDEGRWRCDQFPEAAAALNLLHAGTFTEWNGDVGVWQANDAARRFHGRVIRKP